MKYPPLDAPGPHGILFPQLLAGIDDLVGLFYEKHRVYPNVLYLGVRIVDWLREWNVDTITQLSGMQVIPWEKQGCETNFVCACHQDKETTADFLDQLMPNSRRKRRNIS